MYMIYHMRENIKRKKKDDIPGNCVCERVYNFLINVFLKRRKRWAYNIPLLSKPEISQPKASWASQLSLIFANHVILGQSSII